jgi:hypothetical protein
MGQLQLLAGGRRQSSLRSGRSFRLRPGERPAWVELDPSEGEARAWRHRAEELGLSVDVWLAVQAEWGIVRANLADEERIAAVLEHAKSSADTPALAPTAELRAWLRWLAAPPSGSAEHDLPSVALPARLLARLRPNAVAAELRTYAAGGREQEAIAVERAASLVGMTMEAWGYREALRLAG